jgi:hypothetical protein
LGIETLNIVRRRRRGRASAPAGGGLGNPCLDLWADDRGARPRTSSPPAAHAAPTARAPPPAARPDPRRTRHDHHCHDHHHHERRTPARRLPNRTTAAASRFTTPPATRIRRSRAASAACPHAESPCASGLAAAPGLFPPSAATTRLMNLGRFTASQPCSGSAPPAHLCQGASTHALRKAWRVGSPYAHIQSVLAARRPWQ